MNAPIKIDIWSDIACPWCYVGKRRLESGLAAYAQDEAALPVEVEYHSFELTPEMPDDYDGTHTDFLSTRKGIPVGQVEKMDQRIVEIGASVGLDYHFDSLRPTNTVKAHQVLHLAKARGKQAELKERLLSAYFVEGRRLADPEVLADLAAEVGLDRAEVLDVLANDKFVDDVRADQQQALRYGIQGVPFYVVEGKYGISGAQASETFVEVLRKVAKERDA
ncbi:DsbA family oxidoreductase [Fodinicola feengrottensis]|uniref:DsbA family oxidoreductase n=1 Tax=Fodinicola feengrottensis TaxID=435914 RepID=A0ABP4VB66_9ACTN|nr:DsbA family oxidoreductase [Fodinicola feengrottensis]